MVKFVIISTSRTGSTFVQTSLDSHSLIHCEHEIFGASQNLTRFTLSDGSTVRSIDRSRKFLEEHFWHPVYSKKPVRGFKLFYYHGKDTDSCETVWDCLLEDKSVKILHLKRQNLLWRLASHHIAYHTGLWNMRKLRACRNFKDFLNATLYRFREYEPVTLNAKECEENFQRQLNLQQKLREEFSNHEILELEYETILSNTQREFERIQQFLGVPIEKLKAANIKLPKRSLRESISNYDALRKYFSGSPWSKFFP